MGEAILQFKEEVVKPTRVQAMKLIDEHCKKYKDELVNDFISHFRQFCVQITNVQKTGAKGKVAHFTYSLLRTQIQQGKGLFLAEATDSSWLLDRTPIRSTYDANWAIKPLFQMEEIWAQELKQQSLTYAGKVTLADFEKLRLQEAGVIHSFVAALIRGALFAAVETQEYAEIDKEDIVEVRVGEYMDWSEAVFKEDRSMKGSIDQ
ncbi:hypothetical protein EHV15_23170 [Paenibacillus oralis]|uniref:Uncharacterized protein n=1 Tax=Paenibacillus oralis TaxID=2490856 RepID=A0A3P3U5N9_9BACL|nr:hypothetical protein [Paenibacillus oralis]RRJ65494.1 hypothetical protein EHV15_23170 [Paenibacillus oralis]